MSGYAGGAGKALWATLVNFLRPPVTEGPRPHASRAERYKASFALLNNEHGEEACIGCKLCEKICPSGIITVSNAKPSLSEATGKKRGWASDFTLDLQACIFCELCVQVCPEDAIVMLRVQEKPAYSREALFLSMDRLYANGTAHPHAWSTGSKLHAMQDPDKGLAPADAADGEEA